jgi:hypothetical protein
VPGTISSPCACHSAAIASAKLLDGTARGQRIGVEAG